MTVLNRLMPYVRCAELPLSGKNLKSNFTIDLRYYDNDYHYNNSSMVSQLTQSPLQIANPEQLERIRHTCSHIMAMAVQILFPETKVTIGPTTDTGFYYDFDRPQPFTPEDLKKITKQMRFIIKANLPIIREEVTREEIKAEIEQLNESYKLEILDSIPEGETITRYYIGSPDGGRLPDVGKKLQAALPEPSLIKPVKIPATVSWWDLCAGPHINYTGEINPKAFVLESVAGAYWRGDETKGSTTTHLWYCLGNSRTVRSLFTTTKRSQA